jgi:spermidine synthase
MKEKQYPRYRLLLLIAFLAGFVSLAYEIIATKVLYYFFQENTLTAASVISIFLFGIGLGSFVFGKTDKIIADKRRFVMLIQILVAVYAALIFPNYDLIPSLFNFLYPLLGSSTAMMLTNKLLVSFFYLFFPTFLMGMIFPAIIVMSVEKIEHLPEKIGTLYALDIFGAVSGALVSGFLFIPLWGVKALVFFSVLTNLLIALAAIFQPGKKFILAVFGFLVLSVLFYWIIHPFDRELKIYAFREPNSRYVARDHLLFSDRSDAPYFRKIKVKEKIFFSHTPYGTLSVFDEVKNTEQHRYLYVDSRIQCSTEGLRRNNVSEIIFAKTALDAFKKKNIEVLNIGLGCGFTLNAIVKHPAVQKVDVVEINPLMPKATRCFDAFNDGVINHPKVRLIFNDGYNYLLRSPKKYDVIMMDIEHPSVIYSGNLYTLEFYKLARRALKPGGVFAQWSYRPYPDAQVINYNTLKRVFPAVFPKISGIFNDLFYIAGNVSIALTPQEKNFLAAMLATSDHRISTLNHLSFGNEMLYRDSFSGLD